MIFYHCLPFSIEKTRQPLTQTHSKYCDTQARPGQQGNVIILDSFLPYNLREKTGCSSQVLQLGNLDSRYDMANLRQTAWLLCMFLLGHPIANLYHGLQ